MSIKDNLQTIDDLVKLAHQVLERMDARLLELELYQKAGEIISSVKNSDERFKADFLTNYIEQIQRFRTMFSYLVKPVISEDYLRIIGENKVYLGAMVLSDGEQLEYFNDEQWHFGVLHWDNSKKSYVIYTVFENSVVEEIKGLKVRIRG